MELTKKLSYQQYIELHRELLYATFICKATLTKSIEEIIREQSFLNKYDLTEDEIVQSIKLMKDLHDAALICISNRANSLYNIKIQVNPKYERQ